MFSIDPNTDQDVYKTASVPVLCAAGAMLSGYTRLTYCLVVIMLETTSSINIFVPMTLAIYVARKVGGMFTQGLYSRAIRSKQMPVLKEIVPSSSLNLPAYKVMAKQVVSLPTITDVESVRKALVTTHNAFPVVNTAGNLVGLVQKGILVKLLSKKAFYKKERIDRSSIKKIANSGNNDIGASFEHGPGESKASVNTSLIEVNDANIEMPKKFSLDYDALSGFPDTPKENIVDWVQFNKNVNSDEADPAWVLANICDEYSEEWLDLRPYMIENPITVSVFTKFHDIIEQFRMHHLRHLIVVTPNDGQLCGILTRKDLFAYMGL